VGQGHGRRRGRLIVPAAGAEQPQDGADREEDKGYSASWLRDCLREHGIEPVTAHRKDEKAPA
jgi:hypothetical protein